MENVDIKSLLEALLFTATEPLTLDHFRSILPEADKDIVRALLEEMKTDFENRNSGIVLREIASGYQLYSNPRWHSQIQALFSKPLILRLSRSALETLAVIAYKQPITLPEISEIRSCNSAGSLKTLLECNFVKVLGRKKVVGRPFLYGTSREFLVHFGMKDLSEMPQLEEFEELIGEKLSPDIFRTTEPPEIEPADDTEASSLEAET